MEVESHGGHFIKVGTTIAERLRKYQPLWKKSLGKNLPSAAVLVTLLMAESGEPHVLLTVRAATLTLHPGEVALPGGKSEPQDKGPIETALRETAEEVGLKIKREDVVTVLEPIISRSGFVVYPVVAIVEGKLSPIISKDEVASTFTAPLSSFLSANNHDLLVLGLPNSPLFTHEFRYDGHCIWALTAHILIHVAEISFGRPAEFFFDYALYRFPTTPKSKI